MLLNSGQPGTAHRILLDLLNNVRGGRTPEQIRLIARAANAQGDIASAHHYMAEYYLAVGQLPLAVTQLRMALEVPDLHAVDRARYEARLEEVREYMPENERRRSGSRP
jgi:beta-barrel assembly-enhancing protease